MGLFDVASYLGFEEYTKEDYGQSLAIHGVGPGCYLVLPVLGPSTARDTIASIANFFGGDAWYNVTVKNDTHYFRDEVIIYQRLQVELILGLKTLTLLKILKKTHLIFMLL